MQHILERRAVDFEKQGLTKEQATQKALEFVENDLNNIITKGALELPLDKNGVLVENPQKMFFHLDNKKSVIAVDYQGDRKWVLTAYFKGGDDTPPAQHIRTKARLTAMISAHHHRRYHQMKLYRKIQQKVKLMKAKF
ncbi:hypothetical protein HRB31_001282 [Campylobacter jejuni]|nr:hypothetical protein [Campylobacter jejuni]